MNRLYLIALSFLSLVTGFRLLRTSTSPSSYSSLSSVKQSGPGEKIAKLLQKLPDLSQTAFPTPPEGGYDFIVIGSGPGGEAAAVYAAKLGKKVAIIEKKSSFGGPTGLTSKAVREAAKRICKAVDQVGGDRRRQVRGLWKRGFAALKTEAEVLQAFETRDRLKQSGCDLFIGGAKFVNNNGQVEVRVCRPTACVDLHGQHICIATGSRTNRPSEFRAGVSLPFTRGRVVCATEMGGLTELPNAACVIGGGVIAVEYATILAELGVGVSLICKREQFLPFLEPELRHTLRKMMGKSRILFVEENIAKISVDEDIVRVALEPNPLRPKVERVLRVDLVLYSGGRNANSHELECESAGIEIGKYERIVVDNDLRTKSPSSIFAIGDVIGPPGLASSAQQQGRQLAERLFDVNGEHFSHLPAPAANEADDDSALDNEVDPFFAEPETTSANLFGSTSGWSRAMDAPLTLWTLPEIASVGLSAEQARRLYMDDVIEGRAYFKDMARGRLSGGEGFLKVVARCVDRTHHTIIGVHIIGEGANELIQLGSILVHSKATLEQVSRTPFAAVTLSGLYQMACDNALFSPKRTM